MITSYADALAGFGLEINDVASRLSRIDDGHRIKICPEGTTSGQPVRNSLTLYTNRGGSEL